MADFISIIVSTFDRADALDPLLRSLARQTDRQFEVLIADDGSGPQTAALIEQSQPLLGADLTHVWHEHHGFRLAEIRNRAIRASSGDHCIFLDGDFVARPDYVAIHRELAEHGWSVTGNRALLTQALTDAALRRKVEIEAWGMTRWTSRRIQGAINRLAPLLQLPLGPLRKLRPLQWEGAWACNLAVWRSDVDRVDGFDANFNGWGKEDSDLLVRLLRAGARRKDGIYATGVLHLWRPDADRSQLTQSEQRLAEVIESGRVRRSGISSLDPDATSAWANRRMGAFAAMLGGANTQ